MTTYASNLHTLTGQARGRQIADAKRRFAQALSPPPPGLENQQPKLTRRWAKVQQVNTDGTLNLSLDGATIPNVKCVSSYGPSVGDPVVLDFLGADPIVIGSPKQQYVSLGGTLPSGGLNGAYARLGLASGGNGRLDLGNPNSNGVLWEIASGAGTPAQLQFFTPGTVHGQVDTNGDYTAQRGINHNLWVVMQQQTAQTVAAFTQLAVANWAVYYGSSQSNSFVSGTGVTIPVSGFYVIEFGVGCTAVPTNFVGASLPGGGNGGGWDWRATGASGSGNSNWTFNWATYYGAGTHIYPVLYGGGSITTSAPNTWFAVCKVG